jgi:serine/threonine protein kinase
MIREMTYMMNEWKKMRFFVGDYGRSRFFLKGIKTTMITMGVGSYMYIAPELLSEEEGFVGVIIMFIYLLDNLFYVRKEYKFECDVYSTEMILIEMMESTHPYDGENIIQIILKAKEGKVKPLKSKRSEELVALYNSMRDMVLFLNIFDQPVFFVF